MPAPAGLTRWAFARNDIIRIETDIDDPGETAMIEQVGRIDQFVLMHSARTDRWRDFTDLVAAGPQGVETGQPLRLPGRWRRSRNNTAASW